MKARAMSEAGLNRKLANFKAKRVT